ncbi:MAG: TauD/TfdA family dioxygenase [Pseudomonadota bacterium]
MSTMNIESVSVPGQQHYEEVFPAVLAGTGTSLSLDAFTDWIAENRESLVEQLARHGAILFRGFPIADAHDFDRAIRAFGMPSFTYEESLSNAVRVNKTDIVFTANEAPPDVSIYLHHEMAQTPLFPSRLFFCCETAPSSDGETPLCRSDILLSRLAAAEPAFVASCEALGVRYINTMPAEDDPLSGQGRSWRSTLGVSTQEEAEARLAKLGYSFEWQPDGSLRAITPALPAIRTLVDGRRVFFNQLIAAFRGWRDASKSITFGDGSPMPSSAMDTAIQLADELSFDLAWQAGDIALIDNYLVMHGRRPFVGQRRVLASLVADDGTRLAEAG